MASVDPPLIVDDVSPRRGVPQSVRADHLELGSRAGAERCAGSPAPEARQQTSEGAAERDHPDLGPQPEAGWALPRRSPVRAL